MVDHSQIHSFVAQSIFLFRVGIVFSLVMTLVLLALIYSGGRSLLGIRPAPGGNLAPNTILLRP